ncbi:alkaline phosphatase family protein [Planctomicrobium sp. SH661]|uniref:alkaline phosphatase family protein n=1 Tax=Planctomicrobium sp. SH661 TaxID=3448124 RepID=UPI003F5B5792
MLTFRFPLVFTLLVTFASVSLGQDDGLAQHVVLISVDGLPAELLNDPAVPLDAIRGLALEGVAAEGMIPSNPSVTWPNHTTLVTGAQPIDHGVLFNGVLERTGLGLPVQVNPKTDGSELVRIPTLADALHAQGRKVVGINWPCTHNSPAYFVDFPDTPDMMKYTTPAFLDELIQAELVDPDIRNSFAKLSPLARDQVWTSAACYALEKYKPALTLVHLLNLDAVHHRYGSGTWAGYSAMAYEDTRVQKILDTLDETGMRPHTTVIVVSDHGFMTIPQTINPNVLLRQNDLLTVEGDRITAATVQAYPEGGVAMVYLTRPDTAQADLAKAIQIFEGAEGIAGILTPEQYPELGLPQPDEYPQMADFILVAKDGYGFSGTATGSEFITKSTATLGTHGFLSTNPRMKATFVAEGAGIKPGVKLGVFENTRVAPTIARLLGVELKSATAEPLNEILLAPAR